MLPPNPNVQVDPKEKAKTGDIQELLAKLSPEQVKELEVYMDRIKSEYLQKILE